MFNSTGIDLGTTGTRRVSVGMYWGSPVKGDMGGRKTAAVPSDILTFRKVALPPAGREVCRRVVQEELAYSLPFPLEHAAWAYTGRPGQEAWVVVAPLQELAKTRTLAGDKASLDVEPLAYFRAAQANGVRSALVIDLGATTTTVCALLPGQLEWVRVLLRGGRALTQRIANEQKCSPEKAEEIKRAKGCELEICRRFIQELLDEVMAEGPLPYDRALLCGGGAALKDLLPLLKQRFKLEPELFPLPSPLSPYEDVVAYGTALSEKIGQPRARLVSAAIGGLPTTHWRHWSGVAMLTVACCFLVVIQTEARLNTLKARQKARHVELKKLLQGHDVKDEALNDPAQLVKDLKATIAERKTMRAESLQNVMDSLSRAAGPVREVASSDVRALQFDGSKFHLEGQTASVKDLQKLREALAKLFGDIQVDKSAPGPDSRYVYHFEWKLPEP
jgi:hypothetical protein